MIQQVYSRKALHTLTLEHTIPTTYEYMQWKTPHLYNHTFVWVNNRPPTIIWCPRCIFFLLFVVVVAITMNVSTPIDVSMSAPRFAICSWCTKVWRSWQWKWTIEAGGKKMDDLLMKFDMLIRYRNLFYYILLVLKRDGGRWMNAVSIGIKHTVGIVNCGHTLTATFIPELLSVFGIDMTMGKKCLWHAMLQRTSIYTLTENTAAASLKPLQILIELMPW